MYTGPKLTNNNLVFGYDTGYGIANAAVPTRFFKGKPTTNLASGLVKTFNSWSNLQGQTDYYTREGSQGVFLQVTTSGGVQWHGSNQINNVSSSTVYTISATIKWTGVTPHTNLFYVRQYNASSNQVVEGGHFSTSYMIDLGDGWYRAYRTFTTTSTTTYLRIQGYQYSANANIYYQDEQLELGGQLTPYPGDGATRSDTASLIDLTKATDLTLSAMSYDSDGQPEFDGTDDFIPVNNLLASQAIGAATQLTISMWLNPDTHSDDMPFSTGQSGNDRIYYWTTNGVNTWRVNGYTSTTGHGTLPAIGNWYNTVLVIDGLSIRVYLNGVEDYTASYTAFTTEHYATFGRHGASSSYYYNGKIAVARIHDKAMSAEEIKSNFNAYKNRFNL